METYIGYRGRQIFLMSDSPIQSSNMDCMLVPPEIVKEDLINDYEIWRGRILKKGSLRPWNELRVAFVGVYRLQCGISTYSEWLFPAIGEEVQEYKIFSEVLENAAPEDNVVRCWKRGEPLSDLIRQIHEYKPDIVHVQHEYGIFPDARHWIAFMSQMNRYRTFVTLHSIYKDHHDKTMCEAVVQNIIAHTELGKKLLSDRGMRSISVIPHGCLPCTDRKRHFNMYRSKHTFMQFGFGFEYKGWENSIKAAHSLKQKYPDVFFTGIFSESKFSISQHENLYQKLMAMVNDLGLQDNVGIIRGFVSDHVLDCFIRTNQAAVFPYIENGVHTVYGVTGAARVAMTAGVPVVVSKVPIFYDLQDVCSTADTPDQLAVEIELLWKDKKHAENQIAKQNKFLETNSWKNVAIRHLELFSPM